MTTMQIMMLMIMMTMTMTILLLSPKEVRDAMGSCAMHPEILKMHLLDACSGKICKTSLGKR